MFEKVQEKSFYGPWRQDGWVLGLPPSIIVRNRAPFGAGLARKVLWEDDLAPFSSDKIRAKILDLGYGGARRALHNLSPKSLLGFYQRQSLAQPCSPQGLGDCVTSSTQE